jgi:Tol biopolymer transport system component
LLFESNGGKTGGDIWYLDMEKTSTPPQPKPYLQTSFQERNARFSPDGRFVSYQSNESGDQEIYVQTFPDPKGGKWTVSKGGGQRPVWRRDGKELFYVVPQATRGFVGGDAFSGPRQLMAVEVSTAASGPYFKAGAPKMLFTTPPGTIPYATLDGQRFLDFIIPGTAPVAGTNAGRTPSVPITLVLNWEPRAKK